MSDPVLRIRAEGRPAPKGSRIQGVTKKGRMYTRPASKYEAPWVKAVKQATELQVRHLTVLPPYVVDIQIFVEKPKHKPSKPWPSQHDVDKLARAIVDGLVQGHALDDDRNVTELHTTKRFVADGETPGCLVYVATAQIQIVAAAA